MALRDVTNVKQDLVAVGKKGVDTAESERQIFAAFCKDKFPKV